MASIADSCMFPISRFSLSINWLDNISHVSRMTLFSLDCVSFDNSSNFWTIFDTCAGVALLLFGSKSVSALHESIKSNATKSTVMCAEVGLLDLECMFFNGVRMSHSIT